MCRWSRDSVQSCDCGSSKGHSYKVSAKVLGSQSRLLSSDLRITSPTQKHTDQVAHTEEEQGGAGAGKAPQRGRSSYLGCVLTPRLQTL